VSIVQKSKMAVDQPDAGADLYLILLPVDEPGEIPRHFKFIQSVDRDPVNQLEESWIQIKAAPTQRREREAVLT
jgi:hypothetical protein